MVNVWNIALKEIRMDLCDKKTLVLMLAFPIALMLMLGSALTNAFNNGLTVDDMRLIYANTSASPQLAEAWKRFAAALEEKNVELVPAEASNDGVKEVQEGNATAYAVVGDSGIQFYGSSRHPIESNVLQGMLTSFADRYSLAAAAMQTDPAAAQTVLQHTGATSGFIRETGLEADRKPGSMDYYALVMSTMIAFYSAMSASFLIRGERLRKTALRLAAAPVGKGELLAGKVVGSTVIHALFVLVVVLFSKYAFQVNWGDHLGVVLLVLLTEVMLAVSVGLGVSYMFKENASTAVLMIVAQLASFFGGAYFPLGELTGFMNVAAHASPLYWVNTALMKVIYEGDVQAALPVVGLNIGIASVFLLFSAMMIRRREAL